MPESVLRRLAGRIGAPVGPRDLQRAVLHLLDWTGCAVAGSKSDAGGVFRHGLGDTADPHRDLFFLGALGNVLEMDDVDKRALLHPGPVIIPAALVAAADADASATAFLTAIVRGYEATIRVGRAVGPRHYAIWHNTATCGPFGAASAAASLYNLNTEQVANALAAAGAQSSGLWQVRHEPTSHGKQLHTAHAAHAGWVAARLARAGYIGVERLIEGEQGFFAAMCPGADPQSVVAKADKPCWAIHEVSFKPWPACRHAHAAIDAALILRRQRPDWRAAENITVQAYRDAVVFCDNPEPTDKIGAKFSLQHAVAITLLRGEPTLADFEQRTRDDPEVSALRNRILVCEDSAFSEVYPGHFGARLEAMFVDGPESVEVSDALGDPENPASDELIVGKARMLLEAGGLAATTTERLIDATLSLSGGGSLRTYFRLLMKEALA